MKNIKPTIKDIAERAGVTRTTVSLAFQPESRISEAMRKKIFSIAKKLNYVPNLAARQLRQGKSRVKILGVMVTDIVNPFNALMIHAAEVAAAERGYGIIIADSQWSAPKERARIQSLIEFRVDGIMACFCEKDLDNLNWLYRFSGPFLLLDTHPAGYTGPYVSSDMEGAADMSIDHLVQAGCRHPVFVSAESEMDRFSAIAALRRQFKKALLRHKLPFDDRQVIPGGLTIEKGRAAFADVMKNNPRADGIFCVNSLAALGIMSAAKEGGIKIGSDLAVIGIDDLDICRLPDISLTTIRFSYDEMARVAANVLIDSIEAQKPPTTRIMIKPELVVRDSTRRR